ncbi:HAD-like domain-containing protein [Haematococcus lacustris]
MGWRRSLSLFSFLRAVKPAVSPFQFTRRSNSGEIATDRGFHVPPMKALRLNWRTPRLRQDRCKCAALRPQILDGAAAQACLADIDCILFDCDGVLWKGSQQVHNAAPALQVLRKQGKQLLFCTNNASKSRAGYVAKFSSLGLDVQAHEIVSASYAAAAYLASQPGFNSQPSPQAMDDPAAASTQKRVLLLGNSGIEQELDQAGIAWVGGEAWAPPSSLSLTPDAMNGVVLDASIGAVLVGWDPGFSYSKLVYACACLNELPGCLFVATNPDHADVIGPPHHPPVYCAPLPGNPPMLPSPPLPHSPPESSTPLLTMANSSPKPTHTHLPQPLPPPSQPLSPQQPAPHLDLTSAAAPSQTATARSTATEPPHSHSHSHSHSQPQAVREVGCWTPTSLLEVPKEPSPPPCPQGLAATMSSLLPLDAKVEEAEAGAEAGLPRRGSLQRMMPGTGAIAAAVALASGRQPVVVGKGGPWLLPHLLQRYGLVPERTAIVGDRLDTDIALGREGGLLTILPLTGVTDLNTAVEAPPDQGPHIIVNSIATLAGLPCSSDT